MKAPKKSNHHLCDYKTDYHHHDYDHDKDNHHDQKSNHNKENNCNHQKDNDNHKNHDYHHKAKLWQECLSEKCSIRNSV